MRAWLDPVKLAIYNMAVNQVITAINEQNIQAAVRQFGAELNPDDT